MAQRGRQGCLTFSSAWRAWSAPCRNGGRGTRVRPRNSNQVQAEFDRFWNSRFRHDIDAFDYFIANQDRHKGNVMTRMEDDQPSPMLIDQDSGVPASPSDSPGSDPETSCSLAARPAAIITSELAGRFHELSARFPEAELRRWLTEKEVDGLWSRLHEVVDALNERPYRNIEESPDRAAETARPVPSTRRTSGNGAAAPSRAAVVRKTQTVARSRPAGPRGTQAAAVSRPMEPRRVQAGAASRTSGVRKTPTGGTTEVASTKTAPTGPSPTPSPVCRLWGADCDPTGPRQPATQPKTQEPARRPHALR